MFRWKRQLGRPVSRTSNRTDGDIIRDFLSVADLLKESQLAQLYAYLVHEYEATVQDMIDDLELGQGTAYSNVNRLVDAGVVEVTHDEQPRRYAAREIDLTVTTAAGDREYTITPALIDAVGRRETDADIDTYIDRHGVAGLATALTYAVARERGEVTHRLMAEDLDVSPLAAEMILQALRPVVHEHYEIEESGAGLDELDIDGDAADDA
nr:helix-turn-helix domain-containing protein [Salinirubrum litoreum]